ncbi:MAG: D-aminoacylase, partial [Vicinamibacteria bacterium]
MHRWTFLLALFVCDAASPQERFDVLIRGGRVLDGTGNPWFRRDIGVRGGRIAAVATRGALEGEADRVLDASNLYVAPGFIDVHSHADEGLD